MTKRMSGAEGRLLRQLRTRAFRKQGGLCVWCSAPMTLPIGAETDDTDPRLCTAEHMIPTHGGGQTTHWNVAAACKKCNNSRHPEINATRGGLVASAGNTAPTSPFSALKALFADSKPGA